MFRLLVHIQQMLLNIVRLMTSCKDRGRNLGKSKPFPFLWHLRWCVNTDLNTLLSKGYAR